LRKGTHESSLAGAEELYSDNREPERVAGCGSGDKQQEWLRKSGVSRSQGLLSREPHVYGRRRYHVKVTSRMEREALPQPP
jgi:hypothetical protein